MGIPPCQNKVNFKNTYCYVMSVFLNPFDVDPESSNSTASESSLKKYMIPLLSDSDAEKMKKKPSYVFL